MSIATEQQRLIDAKAAIKSSVNNKGVTIPTETKLDGYAAYIDTITTGSGGTNISDADATISDVLDGITFYAGSEPRKTGTMTNNGTVGADITTKGQQVTIDEGYHSGSGIVQISATEQAKIISENIKKDVVILGTTGTLESGVVEPEWVAPTDWIQLPQPANNEILMLVGDFLPYIAFKVSVVGGYTVDWGDGTSNNYASAASARHTYAVGGGQYCGRGYTTYKIRIYAQIPTNNITNYSNDLGLITQPDCSILWVRMGTTGLTSLFYAFGGFTAPVQFSRYMERLELPTSLTSCTSFAYMCQRCASLQSVRMPSTYSSSNISFDGAFQDCVSLKKINYNVSSINASLFSNCHSANTSLKEIIFPTTVNNCISWANFLIACSSLPSFTLPIINTNVICGSMFGGCRNLKEIIFNSSWNGRIVDMNGMFNTTSSLAKLVLPSTTISTGVHWVYVYSSPLLKEITLPTNTGTLTNVSNLFLDNSNLETVNNFPVLNSVTIFTAAFRNCYRLKNIANLDQLGDTTTDMDLTGTFQNCHSLLSLNLRVKVTKFVLAGYTTAKAKLNSLRLDNPNSTFSGTSPQIDIAYTDMSAAAILELITNAPTVTSKTIRVTGCTGAADTSNDAFINSKGWTINRTT